MKRFTIRGSFSRERFVAGARFIAAERGLWAVSLSAVAAQVGTTRSAVQRQFDTSHALRLAVVEEWTYAVAQLRLADVSRDVEGIWALVHRWFVAQARRPMPFELARRPPVGRGEAGWDELRSLVSAALDRWRQLLDAAVRQVDGAHWRDGVEPAELATTLFLLTGGVSVASATLGERVAIRHAASLCLSALGRAAAPPPAEALTRLSAAVDVGLSSRPGLDCIAKEADIGRAAKPRPRPDARTSGHAREAPRTWDELLAQAQRELAEYRRSHPEELLER